MSLEDITLPTNKTETRVSNNRRRIRTGEKGLTISVTVVDANDQPYDLSNIKIEFNERKEEGKIVVDDGSADEGGKFTVADAKGGTFTYKLAPAVYAASGICWFVLKQGDQVIDTTKDFYFDVLQDTVLHINNDNYVSSMEAQLDYFKALYSKANDTYNSEANKFEQGLTSWQNSFNQLKTDWQTQTDKINQDWQSQTQTIAENASKQLSDEDTSFKQQLADQIKQITDQRDAAIKQANQAFSDQRDQLASQFTKWMTDEQEQYNTDIADLKKQLDTVRDGISTVTTSDMPAMQKQVDDVKQQVANAQAKFASIDFSSYAKKTDVYDKTTMDGLLAQAGKLKTISIGNNDPISPDDKGNVKLDVPTVEAVVALVNTRPLKNQVYSKTDADAKFATSSAVENAIIDWSQKNTDLSSKVDAVTSTVSGYNADIKELKEKVSVGYIPQLTQAEYDALPDTLKQNGTFLITDDTSSSTTSGS